MAFRQFVGILQSLPNCLCDRITHGKTIVKAHLFLGWVHIDVESLGTHLQEKKGHGILPLHQCGVKPFPQSIIDGLAFDWPAV